MARTISAKDQVRKVRFQVLRSLYYKQNLPSALINEMSVSAEISSMIELKMIWKDRSGLHLSELGKEYLFKISGNRKPPMIDFDKSAIVPAEDRKEFIVRSSLAAEIFREVRLSE